MKKLFQIKFTWKDEVIFEGKYESKRDCILDAIKKVANLRDANLWGANLRDADLRGADLRGADLRDADLRDADLRGADLWDANLRDADLRGANLRDANLRGADLWGADLRGADLWGEKLKTTPKQIIGLKYFIMIAGTKMKIGYELHTIEEWESFKMTDIIKMDGKEAWKWWKTWKPVLLKMCKEHLEERKSA